MDKDLILMLGEIRGDMKGLHSKVDEMLGEVKKTNGRVTKLEQWKENVMGKITILVVIVGAIWSLASKAILNYLQ